MFSGVKLSVGSFILLPSLNAKRSMKKEHFSIKAVSFQISHNYSFDTFLFS